MKKVFIIFCLSFFCWLSVAQAQSVMTHLGNYEKRGDKLMYDFAFKAAADDYKIALKDDANKDRIKLKIAECYRMLNIPSESEKWYGEVITNESLIKPEHKLYYAQALNSNGKYEEAKKWYINYQQSNPTDRRADRSIKAIDHVNELLKDSTSSKVENLSINSPNADFSPAFYDKGIVFVSDRGKYSLVKNIYSWNKAGFLNLYYSPANDKGVHEESKLFYENEQNVLHEGPVVFYEGDKKMLFTSSSLTKGKKGKSKDGIVKLKLYYAEFKNGAWTNAKGLPFNSNEYSVGHPTVSSDGNKLYFVSDMPGGKGGTDLYVSNFQNGEWGTPENLGSEINTEGNEMFPFSADGEILYFASNGQGGIGGLDLFSAHLADKKINNLGASINSKADDFGLILYKDGKSGYFTSNRQGGKGDDDLYRFYIKKQQVNIVAIDKKTGKEIPGAGLKIYQDGQAIDSVITDQNGTVNVSLNPGKQYNLVASKELYRITETTIEENNWVADQALKLKVEMSIDPSKVDADRDGTFDDKDKCPEVVGLPSNKGCPEITEEIKRKIILAAKGIFFETGKDIIKSESYDDLDNLFAILSNDTQLNAMVEGHTDNKGDPIKNLDLSQRRANAVKAYLVNKGVSAERLTAIGFGANLPIGNNKTADGRAKNRRVEFKLNY